MNASFPDLRLTGRVHGWQSSGNPLFAGVGDCRVTMKARNSLYVHAGIYLGAGKWANFHLPTHFSSPGFLSQGNNEKLRQVHNHLKALEGRTTHYKIPAGRMNHAYVLAGGGFAGMF